LKWRGSLPVKFELMNTKTSVEKFPYKTYLNTLHGPLEVMDVQKLADACTDKWYNQTLCKVNDSVVRMAVVQGEYHWHEHKDIDEFFFVLDGHFLIDLDDRVIELAPRQGLVVPKGVRHRTRATERTVILMIERADIDEHVGRHHQIGGLERLPGVAADQSITIVEGKGVVKSVPLGPKS